MAGTSERNCSRRGAGGASGARDRWGLASLPAIQSVAPSGVDFRPIDVRDAGEIERGVASFARGEWRPDRDRQRVSGLHPRLIVGFAARHKLPAVYPFRLLRCRGGLSPTAPIRSTNSRRRVYVDRILKGEKPPTFLCRHRPSTNSHQPQDRQGARPQCRRRCSPAPTR